jgi:hypothetical protein
MGKFLDAGDTPGRPKIEEDNVFREKVAQLVGMAAEVIQREISGFLALRREGAEKDQATGQPKKIGKEAPHPVRSLLPGSPAHSGPRGS